jgi:uncharacterized protein YqjF (DUF2071 family)
MKSLFVADWVEVVFLHFAVAPRHVRPLLPLELDLFDGDAYVTLVAFTQCRLRPRVGGRLAALLSAPLASHEFFNVRTYVRHGDDRGIFFLAEWIPNRLAVAIGPRTYGLPYRLGRLHYHNEPCREQKHGEIKSGSARFAYRAITNGDHATVLDDFLLERYTAFTHRDGITRRFHVDHKPWRNSRADAELLDTTLLRFTGEWPPHSKLIGANYSLGVADVAIGPPALASAIKLQ